MVDENRWRLAARCGFAVRLLQQLPSPATAATHCATHRATEILTALLPGCACLLLLLQISLRFGRGLPSVAAVLRPISTLPVIAVDVSVFSCINIVRARSDP